jgi:hypothetical protein
MSTVSRCCFEFGQPRRLGRIVRLSALLSASLLAQTGNLSIVNGKIDFHGATHTATMTVVANVGALPSTGCIVGELAIVTAATLGQQMYQNSGAGTCVWTQQLNTGSSNGGGITVYSAASLSLTGTQYIPIGGGGLPSSTETNVDTASPSAATVTNFDVQMSSAPGMGNSIVFTWRKNATSQSVTCTISGAVNTGCSDTIHSFNVSQGDLLTIQLVTTGVIAGTPNLVTSVQFGTTGSNGTVNTGTQNQVAKYAANGTAVSGSTILSDDGTNAYVAGPLDIKAQPFVIELPNSATGTTLNKLAKAVIVGGVVQAQIITTSTADQAAALGCVIAGAGTTGNALIMIAGTGSCFFDGATTAGDLAVPSATSGGALHDTGAATTPTTGEVLATVGATNACGSPPCLIASNLFMTPDIISGGGNGGGGTKGTVTSVTCGTGLTGGTITKTGTCAVANVLTTNQNIRTIGATFGSFESGAAALSGSKTFCVPTYFAGTIQSVELIGDVSGSATVDVLTVAHSSWTGRASATSITAAAIPALASAARFTDSTLTGWTTSVTAGTDFCFALTSPTTVAGVGITLKVTAN